MRNRISIAVVMTRGLATAYRRWGSGRTVLLLGVPEALAASLGDSFRVIVPDLPPHGLADLEGTRWLGDLCEGLGITRAVIVTAGSLGDAASQLAQDAPERVTGVVEIGPCARDAEEFRAAVEHAFS